MTTPAIALLIAENICFQQHPYQHDAKNYQYSKEVIQELNISSTETFKTLLVTDAKKYYVAVLPLSQQLNLKKTAKFFASKKITMATKQDAERLTGYLIGGISPLAQKIKLQTVIDQTALNFSKIYISGGKRGLEISLSPQDLSDLTEASFADLS